MIPLFSFPGCAECRNWELGKIFQGQQPGGYPCKEQSGEQTQPRIWGRVPHVGINRAKGLAFLRQAIADDDTGGAKGRGVIYGRGVVRSPETQGAGHGIGLPTFKWILSVILYYVNLISIKKITLHIFIFVFQQYLYHIRSNIFYSIHWDIDKDPG